MRRCGTILALAMLVLAGEARADDVCVAAAERAEKMRSAGKLVDARSLLAQCARTDCPKSVQRECTQSMSEVLEMLPSVVPGAKDVHGRDIVDVKVFVDGKAATETLDGKALQVDPGVHVFRFETKSNSAIEERVVVRQGEKNRPLTITFSTTDEPQPAPKVTPDAEPDSGPPVLGYVLGGVGVALLGVSLLIDLRASSDARSLRQDCAPNCAQSQVDDIRGRYVLAGVGAGIGGAALIAGIVLVLTHSHKTRAAKAGSLELRF